MTNKCFLTQVVQGRRYLIHPQVVGTVLENVPVTDITPVVVLRSDDLESYDQKLLDFEKDDVYCEEFSKSLVILDQYAESIDSTQSSLTTLAPVYHARADSVIDGILPGPYFLHGSKIHQAWRLYPDDLDAFIFGVIPEMGVGASAGSFTTLGTTTDDGMWKEIAVPSRLYSKQTPQKPLAGKRVSLKDIFKLAGTKTTMMSRNYSELYGPDDDSADYTKKLIDLGVVVVGKTKMTQFASSDEPTDQWIDFHCPINPRGDMYQSPSGSSSGAAASLAGYSWLDFSIAGDSAGSVRAPATCNGLYSLRPSVGSTSIKGITVNSPMFDVVGLFSRELSGLRHIVSRTLEVNNFSREGNGFPRKIIYPLDFFPHSNPQHQKMVDDLIRILEDFLGTKRVEISIAKEWDNHPPPQADKKSLQAYLSKSAFWAMCYDYYHGFDEFRARYHKKMGKEPYEGPVVEYRWGIGKDVTSKQNQQYREKLRVFREWFNEKIMSQHNETLSNAIMIMPYGSATPKYRDRPNETPSSSQTIGEKFISPVLQMPQLVLPFAQMPYQSRISGRQEYRPIASTLVGAKGSDLMLIELAEEAFKKAGWRTEITTGREMFPLADNLRNAALAPGTPTPSKSDKKVVEEDDPSQSEKTMVPSPSTVTLSENKVEKKAREEGTVKKISGGRKLLQRLRGCF